MEEKQESLQNAQSILSQEEKNALTASSILMHSHIPYGPNRRYYGPDRPYIPRPIEPRREVDSKKQIRFWAEM